jgi:hypothetical protein
MPYSMARRSPTSRAVPVAESKLAELILSVATTINHHCHGHGHGLGIIARRRSAPFLREERRESAASTPSPTRHRGGTITAEVEGKNRRVAARGSIETAAAGATATPRLLASCAAFSSIHRESDCLLFLLAAVAVVGSWRDRFKMEEGV